MVNVFVLSRSVDWGTVTILSTNPDWIVPERRESAVAAAILLLMQGLLLLSDASTTEIHL
jgi:hypothetical protein